MLYSANGNETHKYIAEIRPLITKTVSHNVVKLLRFSFVVLINLARDLSRALTEASYAFRLINWSTSSNHRFNNEPRCTRY